MSVQTHTHRLMANIYSPTPELKTVAIDELLLI